MPWTFLLEAVVVIDNNNNNNNNVIVDHPVEIEPVNQKFVLWKKY
jgi:hypothetical protein